MKRLALTPLIIASLCSLAFVDANSASAQVGNPPGGFSRWTTDSLRHGPTQPDLPMRPTGDWRFGLRLQSQRTFYGLGWRVTETQRFGPAERAGLRPGDVVLAVAGRRVHTRSQRYVSNLLQAPPVAADASDRPPLVLTVQRDGRLAEVEIAPVHKSQVRPKAPTPSITLASHDAPVEPTRRPMNL